ncbi:MAG: ATP-binding domain-containing protein, partial [Bacteroidales bacterium]|nr:ATP-binding domain-containing protein [Bacteroidales bacterium]
ELIDLWNKVRNIEETILEQNVVNNYSETLNESIFEHSEEDQIILCLNYDGLYGINNINKFLQSNNPNLANIWGNLIYKIDDPILFNDTKRFGTSIYNNLKGKIVNIVILENHIQFDIEIYEVLNEMDEDGFELIGSAENGNSIIRFSVGHQTSSDEDDDTTDDLMPFQVAYAVSIHKAQGLEYDSVKIVISDEVDEMITHNIFYTAITRAKKKLKIYWSPETEKKVLENLEPRNNKRDVGLLKSKI